MPVLDKNYDFIDNNRLTAKYYKFKIIPKEIKRYDYIYHLDFGRLDYLNSLSEIYLQFLVNNIKDKTLILYSHNKFSDDLNYNLNFDKTISKSSLSKYINGINRKVYNYKHPELSNFIRNIKDIETNNIFEKIYDELIINKLTRDQMVFTNTLLKYDFNMNKIKFVLILYLLRYKKLTNIFFKYLLLFN